MVLIILCFLIADMVMFNFFYYSMATPLNEETPIQEPDHAVNPAQPMIINKKLAEIRLSQVSSSSSAQVVDPSAPIGKVLSPAPLQTLVDVKAIIDTPPSPSHGVFPRDPPRTKVGASPEKPVDAEGSSSPPRVRKKRLISKTTAPSANRSRTIRDVTSSFVPLDIPEAQVVGEQRSSLPPHSKNGKSSRSMEPEESEFNKNLNRLSMTHKYFSQFSSQALKEGLKGASKGDSERV